MLRYAEPHGSLINETAGWRGHRPLNAISLIQSVRSLRTDYFARLFRRGFGILGRETGLLNVFASCRGHIRKRRTLLALKSLDDRLLSDIGIRRSEIEATAAFFSKEPPANRNTLWYGLSNWASREAQRRRLNSGHDHSTAA